MKQMLDKLLRAHPPIRFATDVVDVYFTKRVSRAAAELAYFLILTFFPIMICISAFVNELHLDLAALVEQADPFLPEGVLVLFRDYLVYIDTNQSTAMLLTGVFLTVLFASAAVRGLMNIMHELYGRATFRGLWQLVASILFSVLLLATIYLSLAVVVTGNWFFHLLGQVLRLENLVEQSGAWQSVKYLLLLAMVFLFILLLYRFAAPLDNPRPPVVPGALAASAALAIASMIFSILMGNSTRYSLIYGSLASVIILLVWLYLCGNILIMGNVVNYVLFIHRRERDRA
ncbi:MAG: YihY/virulence factor BrkB family protein [Clostridiales bacterium]|nr:YihY/virulence factor BrkB family protein [Clostridiales bacterium]